MLALFAISAIASVAALQLSIDGLDEQVAQKQAFDALRVAHSRAYDETHDEYKMRFATFLDNIERIRKQRERSPQAEFKLNLFFDMDEGEFEKMKMAPRSIYEDVDQNNIDKRSCLGGGATKRSLGDGGAEDAAAVEEEDLSGFPEHLDWRMHHPPVVTPVKNQGQCGSCWTFSTTETLESAWALAGHGLLELAPQQIVDCSHECIIEDGQEVCDSGCAGGWPWAAAMTLMKEGGQELEKNYPYQGVDGTCRFNATLIAARISNYTCISGPQTATLQATMTALSQQPLSVAMDASAWQFYSGGVFSDPECSQTQLDHAITLEGWGSDNGTPYWLVRNSWSASWGLNGYLKLARGNNECGVRNAVMSIQVPPKEQ